MAHRLVESLAGPFEPAKCQDTYRQNLRSLIDAKIRGEELKPEAERPTLSPVPDIMEALKASLARGKKAVEVAKPQPVARRSGKAVAS